MLRLQTRDIRSFWHTTALAATAGAGEGALSLLLDYALRFLRLALLLSVWRVILFPPAGTPSGGGPPAAALGGMTPEGILTYTLIAGVCADPLAARTRLELTLWDGSIAARLLRPFNLVAQIAAEMIGGWLPGLLLFSLPILLLAPLLGVDPRPAGPAAALLFPLSLALGVTVGMAVDFLLCALMVSFGWAVWEVERWRTALSTVLSGALLPLAVLPWNLGEVLVWLPFAAMAWAPLSVYTGTGDPRLLLAAQVLWAAVLWGLARHLWRRSRQKAVIYGG